MFTLLSNNASNNILHINKKENVVGNLITLEPIQQTVMTVKINGTSPFIQHKWAEKSLKMIRDKKAGLRVKNREVCDPEQEFRDACYRLTDGRYGFPAGGVKQCLIGAAHKDIGLEKTLLKKSLFIQPDDRELNLIALITDEPKMREDIVRVGSGSTDLRYRPEFSEWSMVITFEFDSKALSQEAILNLIDRAGFGVGLGEWRPEKGGEHGRFKLDREYGIDYVGKVA
jgi:hypothetical protein|tara:strand:+ start:343 stop:1026 length:684 start_codon:yes stop_codon:yes gene_type:complete